MTEAEIIPILKREVGRLVKTGKPPAPGALPKWLTYLDHCFNCSLQATLTASAKIRNRTRVFSAIYNRETRQHSFYIDGVEY